MDWGVITGIAALCGVIVNFIHFGRWQGSIETRVAAQEKTSDSHDVRMENLTKLMSKQNDLLTEIKVKLDMLFSEKKMRRKT